MVRAGARRICTRIYIGSAVRAARMRNTLLHIKVVYWNCTGVYRLQMSCGWWKMSSPANLVAHVRYERANEL
jgi:hypothetical protein